jgi:uncharacterized protein
MLDNLAANWPYLILMGITAGFTSGLLGIGGGVILVPLVILVTASTQQEAQGLSLGYMIITALVGFVAYRYRFDVKLDYRVIALLTLGGVFGALAGAWGANHISSFWLRKIFALLMIAVALKLIIERPKTPATSTQPLAVAAENDTPVADIR